MSNWREPRIGMEGDDTQVGGVAIWQQDWRATGEAAVQLPHPGYPHQRHRFDIYEAGSEGRRIRFAAGELSSGVWGFYVPQ